MNRLTLERIAPEKKRQMYEIVRRWKETGSQTAILQEALRTLAVPGRVNRRMLLFEKSDERSRSIVGIAFDYGARGQDIKGRLDQHGATVLKEIVDQSVHGVQPKDQSELIDRIARVLLLGEQMPTQRDPIWEIAFRVLRTIDARVIQTSLL